jgi:hypothetical protein
MDKELLDVFKYGKYYNPAYLHYNKSDAVVICDRCKRSNLKICIGHGSNDLCMICVSEIGDLVRYKLDAPIGSRMMQTMYLPKTETPVRTKMESGIYRRPIEYTTDMEQDIYNIPRVAQMMQSMYNKLPRHITCNTAGCDCHTGNVNRHSVNELAQVAERRKNAKNPSMIQSNSYSDDNGSSDCGVRSDGWPRGSMMLQNMYGMGGSSMMGPINDDRDYENRSFMIQSMYHSNNRNGQNDNYRNGRNSRMDDRNDDDVQTLMMQGMYR